jgi:phosphodiesterase/alkaline phosphatase D-like protein
MPAWCSGRALRPTRSTAAASSARWNVIAPQTLMAQAGRGKGEALYWTDGKRVAQMLERNPHIHLANGSKRGYLLVDVTARRMETKLRAMETVKRHDGDIETLASWIVEDGKAGAMAA